MHAAPDLAIIGGLIYRDTPHDCHHHGYELDLQYSPLLFAFVALQKFKAIELTEISESDPLLLAWCVYSVCLHSLSATFLF